MSLSLRARFWYFLMRTTFKGQRRTVADDRARMVQNARFVGRLPREVAFERLMLAGLPAAWLRPDSADQAKVLLYLHGGGYVIGSIDSYKMLCGHLARALQFNLLIPEYRLAPEQPFPAAVEDAQKVYRWLLAQGYQPKNIVIVGDSAGGGLSLAAVLALREAGDPLPAAVVCLSPWADLAFTGQSHATKTAAEAMLTSAGLREWAAYYADTEKPTHPLISPVYADFHGFPPLLIQVGSEEILLDDALMVAEKAQADGVAVTLQVWASLWHVWHALGDLLPENRRAFAEIRQFVRRQLKEAD
jgi:epsilon-lactone hydrolase